MDDFDICSQDPELERLYAEISGRKNESIFPFLKRSFKDACKRISEPSKAHYDTSDLKFSSKSSFSRVDRFSFELSEFDVTSNLLKLHCALWKSKLIKRNDKLPLKSRPLPCIIYMHTNTRSLADAIELQPLASITGFNLIAFDMPGAGKSEGTLSASCATVINHIDNIVSWATSNLNVGEVVLWARGMSTAAAVEYTSNSASRGVHHDLVKFLVLDTPYCSVKQVVDNVVQKYKEKNSYVVISPLVHACAFMFGREVTSNLGADIYAVKPINFASKNKTPCLILKAKNDDYIPASHSDQFHTLWAGPVNTVALSGTHYSSRDRDTVLTAYYYLSRYVTHPEVLHDPLISKESS
jgi:pimeloyl-ACP methyl ester carboxylesterase